MADHTRDGDGYWLSGKWLTTANYNARIVQQRLAAGFSQEDAYQGLEEAPPGDVAAEVQLEQEQVEKAWRTHHDPGSPEEAHSRRVRFDKYIAMQGLLMELTAASTLNVGVNHLRDRAKEILAGMQPTFREARPQGTAELAVIRAAEIEALAFAYRLVGRLNGSEPSLNHHAALITLEALRAWERDHPPAALDLPL
jgi:hypothetical protein